MCSKPNKSANEKDITLETCEMQCDVNVSDQQGVHADMQRMQSPIFNIHIHVPAYEGDNFKMYLPRIQPVIHLHFDELARKLDINQGEQSEEATYRAFQKLLSVTAPRFGDVRFHYRNRPNKTVNRNKEFQCQDKRSEIVNRNKEFNRPAPSFSLNYSNDAGAHASENLERLKSRSRIPGNCGMPDCCGSQSSLEDSDNLSECDSDSEETLSQKFNLKEAVVVLEDVCKTEYYKNMVAAGLIRDSTVDNESECDDDLLRRVGSAGEQESSTTEEYENCYIKCENESYSPESGSSSRGKALSENLNANPLNPNNQLQCRLLASSLATKMTGSAQNMPNTEAGSSEKTLSSLAEGCNFSDILSRFQMKKYEEIDEDSVKCSMDVTQSEGLRSNERCNHNERILEHLCNDEPVTRTTSLHGRESTARNSSHSSTIQPDFGISRKNYTRTKEPSGTPNKYKEIGPKDIKKSPSNKTNLDGMAWTSQEVTSESRLEMISALSPTWHKHILMFPETRENRLLNLGVSGFQLDVFEEEMGRNKNGRTERNLKKKAIELESSPSKESAPSKKMKPSVDESKKSRAPSEIEDYIPLQASGPTKFAVTPLNKVSPYKTHDARNFKADMLYGKRINRFSSSDQLRIYQLKQEAAKTQSN